MDLILWRHAEAVAKGDPGDDLGRALTAHGERQAARMAGWLQRHLPPDTRVLVSPARRTQQTAAALGRAFETVPVLAPDATADAVLQAAGWPDAGEAVMVVGHQPTLGQVAARLLAGRDDEWVLQKGGICWLRFRRPSPGEPAVALHVVLPAELV